MWWVAQPAICMAQPAIWWANPLQTLSQGLVLTLRFTFDPELDNFILCIRTTFRYLFPNPKTSLQGVLADFLLVLIVIAGYRSH